MNYLAIVVNALLKSQKMILLTQNMIGQKANFDIVLKYDQYRL
jgi:hypothetical protein